MSTYPPTPLPSKGGNESRHLIITGRVQGVGFRAGMAREAQTLGVTGWVRNRTDGSVEAMVSGSAGQIAAMMLWARQGPPGARVDHVAIELGGGTFTDFEQRASV